MMKSDTTIHDVEQYMFAITRKISIKTSPNTLTVIAGALVLLCSTLVQAQQNRDEVTVQTVELNGPVSMLVGAGGNVGVSVGNDGVLMIDAQYADMADRLRAAILDLGGDENPRFLVNTHFHGDHTDGNRAFGEQSTIIAHENVRRRLLDGGMDAAGLPIQTIEDRLSLHFNGELVDIIHFPGGHTDGDVVIFFRDSNVVHMGDLFFQGMFPFVDLGAGGNVQRHIDHLTTILGMIDDDTQIIPGHGVLADRAELQRARDMMHQTALEVRIMKSQNMSREAIVEAGLDEKWAEWSWPFINEQRWIETIYDSYPR